MGEGAGSIWLPIPVTYPGAQEPYKTFAGSSDTCSDSSRVWSQPSCWARYGPFLAQGPGSQGWEGPAADLVCAAVT